MHAKRKTCLFYLYATAKSEIQICSNKDETGRVYHTPHQPLPCWQSGNSLDSIRQPRSIHSFFQEDKFGFSITSLFKDSQTKCSNNSITIYCL